MGAREFACSIVPPACRYRSGRTPALPGARTLRSATKPEGNEYGPTRDGDPSVEDVRLAFTVGTSVLPVPGFGWEAADRRAMVADHLVRLSSPGALSATQSGHDWPLSAAAKLAAGGRPGSGGPPGDRAPVLRRLPAAATDPSGRSPGN